MTRDSGRHAQRGDVQQAPPVGCQSAIAQRIPTSPPIGTDQELIERLERKLASNGAWMTSDVRAFYEQLRDALQSRISEGETLKQALADTHNERAEHIAQIERLKPYLKHTTSCLGQKDVNMDDVCRCGLDAALSQQGKV